MEDYVSEAEALEDQSDGGAERDMIRAEIEGNNKTYHQNKLAAVGSRLRCPTCGTIFVKTSYQQAFCKKRVKNKQSQCKVEFHNRNQFWGTRDRLEREQEEIDWNSSHSSY